MADYKYKKMIRIEGHRYYIRAHTYAELKEKIDRKTEEGKRKRKIIKTELTVKQWAETVITDYKSNVTDETLKGYRSKIRRHITPVIGSERVIDVTPLQCQEVMNRMEGNAADTIKKVRELLYFIFEKAIISRYIAVNPAENLTLPKGGKMKRRSISESERAAILHVADEDIERYIYFLFLLFCGLRPSEAARIRRSDITSIDGQQVLHVRGTKTAAADRYVPVPEYLSSRLPDVEPYELICKSKTGCKLTSENRRHLWDAFRRALNIYLGCKVYRNALVPPFPLAPDLTPYCLRHTYCTDLYKAGVDVRVAQKLMGHSSFKITADIYTHIDTHEVADTAPALDTYYDKISSKNVTKKVTFQP